MNTHCHLCSVAKALRGVVVCDFAHFTSTVYTIDDLKIKNV